MAVCIAGILAASAAESPIRLYVTDGQFSGRPFTAFVNREITAEMRPTLRLVGMNAEACSLPASVIDPSHGLAAPNQVRPFKVDGQTVTVEGTLLRFDAPEYKIPAWHSARRILPIVEWSAPVAYGGAGTPPRAVAPTEVYVGNPWWGLFWTLLVIGGMAILVLYWSTLTLKQVSGDKSRLIRRALFYICEGPDGYLSLWQTQLVLWTLAVGSMVFLFGLMRLQIPDIPDSLVVLMGMSIVTGGLGKYKAAVDFDPADAARQQSANPSDPPRKPGEGHLKDLITGFNKAYTKPEISVPKAQMVFWTGLMLVLFIVKSTLQGELWDVPWQMVALTGVSQTGYVADKFQPGKDSGGETQRTETRTLAKS
jgi:hypothetical protein